VTELYFSSEHLGTGTDGPGDDRLGDLAGPDSLDDTVLLNTTDFTEKDKHLAFRVSLVAEKVVDEGGAWVPITTNGNTLVGTVGDEGEDVVQFVGHTTRLGNVTNGARAVELRRGDVIHHTSRVTNSEAARLNTTDSGGTNDEDTSLLGFPEDLAGVTFRDTLGNKSDGFNLRIFETFEGARIYATAGSEVDNNVNVGVLGNGLFDAGIDGEKSLLGTPIKFLDVVTTEGIDHSSNGRSGTTAGVVEVEHALDGTRLKTVYKGASVGIEGPEPGASGKGLAGLEVDNLVLGLGAATIRMDGTHSGFSITNRCN
jgi:hypothetical protein